MLESWQSLDRIKQSRFVILHYKVSKKLLSTHK